jgi:hypothetical protein
MTKQTSKVTATFRTVVNTTTTTSLPTKNTSSVPPALKRTKAKHAPRRFSVLAISSGEEFFQRTLPPKPFRTCLGLHRVTFSGDLTKCSKEPAVSNKKTWYDDAAYSKFAADSGQSLAVIKQQFATAGTVSALDPNEHCVEGLDRFLSYGIQQTLRRMHVDHVQTVLLDQERRRQAAKAAFSKVLSSPSAKKGP